ncbi:MAG TPA: phosphatidylinositol-specific phospholipase C1-like protein [Acidimicrobiales bacterium]|jgi:Phosphoinositide phospholipase C, Ca2+-dependent|nr:phosphatidylinositol-specific phospholipase C1-like protein [Acidimicrobiales bacterium]
MNDIQELASHNSYHIEPEPKLLDLLRGALGDAAADSFQYTHMPLADELDHGVRQIELDLLVDTPEGGRYASPKLVPVAGVDPPDPLLSGPGLKVIHVQEVDFRSTCPTFVSCLEQVRDWSDAHPDHLPITIQLEPKDDTIPDPGLGFVTPIPWSSEAFADADAEIRSVFPDDRIITPADVRGRARTLRQAVEHDGWPTLDDARGQVMFMLDNTGEERDMYRSLHPDVDDRLIFVPAEPPDDDAAVVVVNDPVADADHIDELVSQGYLVRTRADADTVQARSGDTTMRDAAWASGAQFVSTDYIVPDDRFDTGYVVELPGDPGAPARCNPLTAPSTCRPQDLRE